jgi:hypothetical protein
MKNVVAKMGLVAVMTIIAASVSANAQSLNYRLTANIPFDFSVAGQKLPAGKYWINRAQPSNGDTVIQIRSTDGRSNIARLTIPVFGFDPVKTSSLVFNRYGDEYFLSVIWVKGGVTGRELPKSRAEREVARRGEDNGIAAVKALDVKTVTVQAN